MPKIRPPLPSPHRHMPISRFGFRSGRFSATLPPTGHTHTLTTYFHRSPVRDHLQRAIRPARRERRRNFPFPLLEPARFSLSPRASKRARSQHAPTVLINRARSVVRARVSFFSSSCYPTRAVKTPARTASSSSVTTREESFGARGREEKVPRR